MEINQNGIIQNLLNQIASLSLENATLRAALEEQSKRQSEKLPEAGGK